MDEIPELLESVGTAESSRWMACFTQSLCMVSGRAGHARHLRLLAPGATFPPKAERCFCMILSRVAVK